MNSSAASEFNWPGHVSDLVSVSYDEQHIPFLESPEKSKACQNTTIQAETNNASSRVVYGTDDMYGDESGGSHPVRQSCAMVPKTAASETTAVGDCGEACTTRTTQEPSQSSATDLATHCACISCCNIYTAWKWTDGGFRCPFPSCQAVFNTRYSYRTGKHEKSHYGQPGKYTCLEPNCKAVTKNWGDLKRHSKTSHCTSPNKEQFPCPVPWYKRSGNNGFPRKDKLKSHYQNVHEGKPGGPVKAGRVIKPATLKPQVPALGSSAGK